jgi:ADP-ribosylation factor-like protein 1
MGLTFSSLFDALSTLSLWKNHKDVRILMLGLDSAGKVRVADQFLVR